MGAKNHNSRRPIFLPHASFILKRGHEALKLVCLRNVFSIIVVFDFRFKFEIELITSYLKLFIDPRNRKIREM